MVFGGTAARSSAIPTPSEGMTSYRTDTQQIESYDGAQWRGMSGLQLVKAQTVGTGVSSVNVTSAFSSTFENYRIIYSGGSQSANTNIRLQLGASSTGYYAAMPYMQFTSNTVNGATDNNAAFFSYIGGGDTNASFATCELLNPNLAKYTRLLNGKYYIADSTGTNDGVHKVATAYTDFTISPGSGTLTGGTIYVYGFGA